MEILTFFFFKSHLLPNYLYRWLRWILNKWLEQLEFTKSGKKSWVKKLMPPRSFYSIYRCTLCKYGFESTSKIQNSIICLSDVKFIWEIQFYDSNNTKILLGYHCLVLIIIGFGETVLNDFACVALKRFSLNTSKMKITKNELR